MRLRYRRLPALSIDVITAFDGKLLARPMLRALQAVVAGAGVVARAPILILLVYVALAVVVLASAITVARDLDGAFDARAIARVAPADVEAAWFERTPIAQTVIGFAAQLSNLDDLLRANARGPRVFAPMLAWSVVWTLLLGGVLRRYAGAAALKPPAFLAACVRCFPRFAVIAAATLVVYLVCAALYAAAPERLRLPLLIPLAPAIAMATLVASYTRARVAAHDVSLALAFQSSVRMLRVEPVTCVTHGLIALSAWAVLLAVLAWIDRAYGAGSGLWRPLLVAQAYVGARILVRLVWEASSVALAGGRGEAPA